MYRNEETGLWVRDAGHEGIIKEQSEWKDLKKFDYTGATILDLGGHIGCAAWWFKKNLPGIRRIISVEPDPNNVEVYKQNHITVDPRSPYGLPSHVRDIQCHLIEGACVTRENLDVELHEKTHLYLGRTYSACNTLFPTRGRDYVEVEVLDFEFLVNLYQPRAIKCDIEGSEYLIDWRVLAHYPNVQEVAMELHFHKREWEQEAYDLDRTLHELNFKSVRTMKVNHFRKVCTAVWSRRSNRAEA